MTHGNIMRLFGFVALAVATSGVCDAHVWLAQSDWKCTAPVALDRAAFPDKFALVAMTFHCGQPPRRPARAPCSGSYDGPQPPHPAGNDARSIR